MDASSAFVFEISEKLRQTVLETHAHQYSSAQQQQQQEQQEQHPEQEQSHQRNDHVSATAATHSSNHDTCSAQPEEETTKPQTQQRNSACAQQEDNSTTRDEPASENRIPARCDYGPGKENMHEQAEGACSAKTKSQESVANDVQQTQTRTWTFGAARKTQRPQTDTRREDDVEEGEIDAERPLEDDSGSPCSLPARRNNRRMVRVRARGNAAKQGAGAASPDQGTAFKFATPTATGGTSAESVWAGEEMEAYQKLSRMAGKEAVDRLLALNHGKTPSAILRTVQFREKQTEQEPTAEECRAKGNELYKSGDYEGALGFYDKGIKLEDTVLLREFCLCWRAFVFINSKKGWHAFLYGCGMEDCYCTLFVPCQTAVCWCVWSLGSAYNVSKGIVSNEVCVYTYVCMHARMYVCI